MPMEEHRKRITGCVSDEVRMTKRKSVIRLSQKDARKVLSLLNNLPKPNKRLKGAVKQFKSAVRA